MHGVLLEIGLSFNLDSVALVFVGCQVRRRKYIVYIQVGKLNALNGLRVGYHFDAESDIFTGPPIIGFSAEPLQFFDLTDLIQMTGIIGELQILNRNAFVIVNQERRLVAIAIKNGPWPLTVFTNNDRKIRCA